MHQFREELRSCGECGALPGTDCFLRDPHPDRLRAWELYSAARDAPEPATSPAEPAPLPVALVPYAGTLACLDDRGRMWRLEHGGPLGDTPTRWVELPRPRREPGT